jgi:hypothetical protein
VAFIVRELIASVAVREMSPALWVMRVEVRAEWSDFEGVTRAQAAAIVESVLAEMCRLISSSCVPVE